jgi:hypothetical protein
VPAIAFAFGIGGHRTEVLPDVGPPGLPGGDAALDPMLRGLAALGFRAAGRTVSTGRFSSPTHWRWRQLGTTLWLIGPDRRTYATLYRLVPDEPMRISLVTMFDDGGFARTSCPGVAAKAVWRSDYRRLDVRGVGAEQIVAKHQEQIETYTRERGAAPRAMTIAELTAAETVADRPLVRKLASAGYGLIAMFLPALLLPISLHRAPTSGSATPLMICTMAGLYALARWAVHGPLLRYNARRTHTEDLSGRPDDVADDGTILAEGKNERRLRRLAVVAVALSSAWLFACLQNVPRAGAHGGGGIFFELVVIAGIGMLIVHLIGRARGKMPGRQRSLRDPASVWTSLMILNFLFAGWLDWSKGTIHRLLYIVAGLSLIVGYVGWRLEKKRGQ